MCVKITYSEKCAMPECVTAATHIVTLKLSGFLKVKYDFVIIDIHARKELYFILHKPLFCELKIYQVVCCTKRVCCARYTVIAILCIFRLCQNFRTNLFISGVLSNV